MVAIVTFGVMVVTVIGLVVYAVIHKPKPGDYYSTADSEHVSSPDPLDRRASTRTPSPPADDYAVSLLQPPAPTPPGEPRKPVLAPMPPVGVWDEVLSSDAREHELLATLRAKPDDELTRMVYGDLLEGRGELAKARFVRGVEVIPESVRDTQVSWRAITSRDTVDGCIGGDCPREWSKCLPVEGDQFARTCGRCDKTVRYCTGTVETDAAKRRGELTVLDVKPPRRGTNDPVDLAFDPSELTTPSR